MTTLEIADDVAREIPVALTCYKLNSDGSYEPATVLRPSVYIPEGQVWKLWDPQVAKRIREKYGPYVAVMHDSQKDLQPPMFPTFKHILG